MVEGGRQRDWHVAAQDICSNACQLTKCEPSCSGFGGDGVAITPLTEQSAGRASTRTGAPGGRAAPRAKRNGGGHWHWQPMCAVGAPLSPFSPSWHAMTPEARAS